MDTIKEERILFRKFFVEGVRYDEIAKSLGMTRKVISEKYPLIKTKYFEEYDIVRRLKNNVYHPKKRKFGKEFKFASFPSFYDWWMKQGKVCFYCETEEYKIRELVEAGRNRNPNGIYSSQMMNRGRYLELERFNSVEGHNEYSEGNCLLACYFCNNDKSNVISGDDYTKYFKDTGALVHRKNYINKKYELLKLSDK